mmetsp:Transcript_18288/g.30046  ORF Transcript_18288/g.30046 Transcript_18288/m.30046 type:complete len:418 (+) Transcript_18288:122-1375(+)
MNQLPDELLLHVFSFIGDNCATNDIYIYEFGSTVSLKCIASIGAVCSRWQRIVTSRPSDIPVFFSYPGDPRAFTTYARHIVKAHLTSERKFLCAEVCALLSCLPSLVQCEVHIVPGSASWTHASLRELKMKYVSSDYVNYPTDLNMPELRSLFVGCSSETTDPLSHHPSNGDFLLRCVARSPRLVSMGILQPIRSGGVLEALPYKIPCLTSLSMSAITCVSDFARLLSKLPSLRCLDLSHLTYTFYDDINFPKVFNHARPLVSVSLPRLASNTFLHSLAQRASCLASLSLQDNENLSRSGYQAVSTMTGLRTLAFKSLPLQSAEQEQGILGAVMALKQLERLELVDNCLSVAFFKSLSHPSLTKLNLSKSSHLDGDSWNFCAVRFPLLNQLKVTYCPHINAGIPSLGGLRNISVVQF